MLPEFSMEMLVRLLSFAGLLALWGGLEALAPRRARQRRRWQRWPANLMLVALDAALVRLLLGAVLPVGVALWCAEHGWGLLPWLALPSWLAGLLALLALDLLIYWQHRLFHRVPLLWRLHRLHHSDPEVDCTTALRFHPLEILLSVLIKSAAVWALGAPVWSVVLFEVVLNGMALFNHANLRLPLTLDRWLRRLLVTPDMHRVHHSVLAAEMNSNFGFNLSLWDRWFHSYRAQPQAGHTAMELGLAETRHQPTASLPWMLWQPFQTLGRQDEISL